MKKTAKLTLAALMILLTLMSCSARAETYLGIYGGAAIIPNTDIEMPSRGIVVMPDAELATAPLVGGKAGYWLDSFPWIAVEVNLWNNWTEVKGGDDLILLNVGGSLLLQYIYQPVRLYGGGGIVGTCDGELAIGYLAQAGAELRVLRHWAVFSEYRNTWSEIDNKEWDSRFDVTRHEILGGINFHF